MPAVLAYWNLRGLAQAVRLMLEYTETEYENKIYQLGPAPHRFAKSEWKAVKYTLGLDFPNLPYYIDGDIKITQTNAILYYLAEKHNLCGETEKERIHVNMLVGVAGDMRRKWAGYTYDQYGSEDAKKQYMETLAEHLKLLSDFLGKKSWFVGGKVMLPDFLLYELLDINLHLDPSCLKDFKNLQEYHHRFETLPTIKKYVASSRYIKAPINGPSAKFANQ